MDSRLLSSDETTSREGRCKQHIAHHHRIFYHRSRCITLRHLALAIRPIPQARPQPFMQAPPPATRCAIMPSASPPDPMREVLAVMPTPILADRILVCVAWPYAKTSTHVGQIVGS